MTILLSEALAKSAGTDIDQLITFHTSTLLHLTHQRHKSCQGQGFCTLALSTHFLVPITLAQQQDWCDSMVGPSGSSKYRPVDLDTASLKMYWNVVRRFGGEDLWKQLLHMLRDVADKHSTTVACVALQWAMAQGGGGVSFPIVGGSSLCLQSQCTSGAATWLYACINVQGSALLDNL